jgi:hypothetical protein
MSKSIILFEQSPARKATYSVSLEEFGFDVIAIQDFDRLAQILQETAPTGLVLSVPEDIEIPKQRSWAMNSLKSFEVNLPTVVLLDELETFESSGQNLVMLKRPCGLTELISSVYQAVGLKVT